MHGLSTIKKYQLIEVVRKIDELYTNSLNNGGRGDFTRKRNAMLLDAENFTYIFESPTGDEDNSINKVKTALLIIQKDFENKLGFSPINVRPIPLFRIGFFAVDENTPKRISRRYHDSIEEIESSKHICRIRLDKIWNKDYRQVSFPKFKYMLYSKDKEMSFNSQYAVSPALCVSIEFEDDYTSLFERRWCTIKAFINKVIISEQYIAASEIADVLTSECNVSKYKAKTICEVLIAPMDSYRKNFSKGSSPIAIERTMKNGEIKYQFNTAVNSYFNWVSKNYEKVRCETTDGELYLINDGGTSTRKIFQKILAMNSST